MKKLLLLLVASLTMLFCGCTQFDDSRIWDAIDELEDLYDDLDGRVEDLEEACEKMNTNIEALQTLVAALQNNDTITSIAPIKQGDKVVGYTITFSKSEPITIYHGNDGKDGANGADGQDGANGADGKDGKDGYTPQIGIAKDSDNVYYWTLDGEWLLDESGNKIKAVGTDGKDGEDGSNGNDGANGTNGEDGKDGENGADGKDGITPQLEIREGYWWISYDNGATWKELGKATGEDGKDGADGEDGKDGADGANGSDGQDGKDGADGDSLFESVTWDEEYAYFTLADGTVIKIPLSEGAVTKTVEITAVALLASEDHGMLGFCLSDVGFDFEDTSEGGIFLPNSRNHILTLTVDIDDYSVVPQGTFTSEAGDFETRDGCFYQYLGDDWDDSYNCNIDNAVVIVSEDKIEATLTLDNGEVHHVVYEGSLELIWIGGGEEEDTPTPPANEIWYTSTDGEIVEPDGAADFGANIISNTYENGVGIITFDGDVTSIGKFAFYYCESLASITIPDSVTSIGDYAFGSESLVSVSIGNGVTEIGGWAFNHCSSLASVTIPDSVTEIGGYAFYGCSSLTSVTIPDSVTSIGEGAFAGSMSLAEFNGKFASSDGRCLIIDGVLNSFAPVGLTEYTIPDSVTSIGDYAFGDCTSLASVTIPDSVTSIGMGAFDYCESLASITIPESITSIGYDAFWECSSLAEVYCKPTTPPTGGSDMFEYNAEGRKIYVPTENVDAYKAAAYWSDYADDIVGYDF